MKLKNEDYSLFLDITGGGKRKKEYLKLTIYGKPKDTEQRTHNKNAMALADKIRVRRELELQNSAHGFAPTNYDADFVKFFSDYVESYDKKNIKMFQAVLKHFTAFLTKKRITHLAGRGVSQVLCEDFGEYLKTKLNYETPADYFKAFRQVLRRARKEKVIDLEIEEIKVKFVYDRQAIRKPILTVDEVDKIMAVTPPNAEVARAFVLSLNTGIDFATVKSLTWGMIDGIYIVLIRGKNKKQNRLKMNDTALSVLGERGKDDELVFKLPTWEGAVKSIRAWATAAGVNKKITWHSLRHTLGDQMVNDYKVDIRLLQDILGHGELKTTMRYTRIRPDMKDKALDKLPARKLKLPTKKDSK